MEKLNPYACLFQRAILNLISFHHVPPEEICMAALPGRTTHAPPHRSLHINITRDPVTGCLWFWYLYDVLDQKNILVGNVT